MKLDLDAIEHDLKIAECFGFERTRFDVSQVRALVARARAHDDAVKVIREMAEFVEDLSDHAEGLNECYSPSVFESIRRARAILTNPLVVAARKGGGE